MLYPKSFQKLIENFSSLPSVGPKMAERLVLFLFKQNKEGLDEFSENLKAITALKTCEKCFNIAEDKLCEICKNSKRNQEIICVVEEPLDIISIERTGIFGGLYHVIGGTINFGNDKGSDLKINELLKRMRDENISEVILATNPTTEGDATALYVKRKINDLKIENLTISRLAKGMSTGGDIEYADESTLSAALTNRREL